MCTASEHSYVYYIWGVLYTRKSDKKVKRCHGLVDGCELTSVETYCASVSKCTHCILSLWIWSSLSCMIGFPCRLVAAALPIGGEFSIETLVVLLHFNGFFFFSVPPYWAFLMLYRGAFSHFNLSFQKTKKKSSYFVPSGFGFSFFGISSLDRNSPGCQTQIQWISYYITCSNLNGRGSECSICVYFWYGIVRWCLVVWGSYKGISCCLIDWVELTQLIEV